MLQRDLILGEQQPQGDDAGGDEQDQEGAANGGHGHSDKRIRAAGPESAVRGLAAP